MKAPALVIALLTASLLAVSCDDDDGGSGDAGTSADSGTAPGQDSGRDAPADIGASADVAANPADTAGRDAAGASPDASADARPTMLMGDRRMPFSPTDDVSFIDYFVNHHEQATMMAMMEIERGQRSEVKALAMRIRDAQRMEISTLRSARMALTGTATVPPPPPDPAMERAMAAMMSAAGATLDRLFLENMIPHHGAGLAPAQRAMTQLTRVDLHMLAMTIYDEQSREIGEMKQLLGSIGIPEPGSAGARDGGAGTEDEQLIGDLRVPFTPPDDVGFTTFFITHHRMAIEMADQVLARGADADVKAIARQIREAQTKEIMDMQEIRGSRGAPVDPPAPPPDPFMEEAMAKMRAASGAPLDRLFLENMIPHHGAGLPPAKRARPNLSSQKARELARDIFDAQSMEVGEMHTLLERQRASDRDAGVSDAR
jgi:uncharacterized protein (DUF305 family)